MLTLALNIEVLTVNLRQAVELLAARIVRLPQQRRISPNFRQDGFHITLFEAWSAHTTRYSLSARCNPMDPQHQCQQLKQLVRKSVLTQLCIGNDG